MRNICKATKHFFSPTQVVFIDLGYKLTEPESYYLFAELSHPYNDYNYLPFTINFGFNYKQDGTQVPVAFYEVHYGNTKSNGTKLVELNSLQDLLDFFQADVKHSFPNDKYDALLEEVKAIYEACALDFAVEKGDFVEEIESKKPFFDSYFTVSKDHPDHYVAHISFSTSYIHDFKAEGLIHQGVTAHIDFKAVTVNTLYRMANTPVIGEQVSTELDLILNEMFRSNKFLGVRTED